ncbi:hypothetical protein GW17_00017061 [Ensete ventricosum]|nr:hypothetical protein GW17_00017061 [Ensete ventricosum]
MRTAHYRTVPSKIDCRGSISAVGGRLKKKSIVGGRLREKSTVGGRLRKKKGRRRGKEKKKEEGKKEYLAHAPSSPACRRRPRPWPLFLPREATERLPARGERSRRLKETAASSDGGSDEQRRQRRWQRAATAIATSSDRGGEQWQQSRRRNRDSPMRLGLRKQLSVC